MSRVRYERTILILIEGQANPLALTNPPLVILRKERPKDPALDFQNNILQLVKNDTNIGALQTHPTILLGDPVIQRPFYFSFPG